MAIIKCPECGRQVSEMAPTCPGCGVEIAGKVTKCPDCGNVYFKAMPVCPACHRPTDNKNGQSVAADTMSSRPVNADNNREQDYGEQGNHTRRNVILIVLLLVIVAGGVGYYFWNSANQKQELEEYEYAMGSTDPMVLQSYLERFKDADPAHRDSIQMHLAMLQQMDEDWTNAVVSGSREELERYIKEHPDSPHCADAKNKIDSLDYALASKQATVEAYTQYLQNHPDGSFSRQAQDFLDDMKAKTVSSEDAQTIKGLLRRFFQAVNSRNEDGLIVTVAEPMTRLLNKPNATHADVVVFMNAQYKDHVANLNWHLVDDYKIDKKSVGEGLYEFQVELPAERVTNNKDGSVDTKRYSISATINSDGKISELTMKGIAAE